MTFTFSDLNLHPHLMHTIEESGFTTPTPVQEQSIPHIMAGGDVMACAQTGTGKTAAFTLPVAHRLLTIDRAHAGKSPRVIVLTPTRELADQVLQSIRTFIKGSTLKAGVVVGGVSYTPQIKMLQAPLDILVATPGRLMDHMREGRVDLSQVEIVILDEADRMLDMGFAKPVETIVSEVATDHQTLLFSATFDAAVEKLSKQFLKNPTQVRLAASNVQHESITQSMFFTTGKEQKMELMEGILADPKVWQALVFMRTKFATERMAAQIASWGHQASALHGDMRQNARKRVVEQMHKGQLRVLVATDVAARGLDLKDLTHVINFDLPQVAEDYIHRIGRTGRAGAEGTAVSFVSRDEMHLLRGIERILGQKLNAENDAPTATKSKSRDGAGGSKSRGGYKSSGPRSAAPRRDREDRSEGSSEDRPARAPRKEGGWSKDSSDRPRRSAGASAGGASRGNWSKDKDSSDKPKRSFGDKPRGDWNKEGSDKPRRSAGANAGAVSRGNWSKDKNASDKPKRSFGDKPRGDWNKEGSDKPRRSAGASAGGENRGNWAEKPKRSVDGNKWSKDSSDKPKRSFGDKPRGDWNKEGSDKPRRSAGASADGARRGGWGKDKDTEEKPRSPHTRARTGNWQKKKASSAAPSRSFGGNRAPAGGSGPRKPSASRRNAD